MYTPDLIFFSFGPNTKLREKICSELNGRYYFVTDHEYRGQPARMAQRIKDCGLFVAFIDKEYLSHRSSWQQFCFACDRATRILLVILEEGILSPAMEMKLSVFPWLVNDKDTDLIRRLINYPSIKQRAIGFYTESAGVIEGSYLDIW